MNPEKAFNDPIVFYFYTFLISFSALLFPFFFAPPDLQSGGEKEKGFGFWLGNEIRD